MSNKNKHNQIFCLSLTLNNFIFINKVQKENIESLNIKPQLVALGFLGLLLKNKKNITYPFIPFSVKGTFQQPQLNQP